MVVEWWWWCKAIHFLDEIWTLSTPIFSISRTSSRQWPRNVKIKPRKNRSTSRSLLLALLFWACLFVQKRGTYQIPAWKFYPFFFYLPATWLMVSCWGTLEIFRVVLQWKRLDQFTFLSNGMPVSEKWGHKRLFHPSIFGQKCICFSNGGPLLSDFCQVGAVLLEVK